jgi:hypothetical protein
VRITQALGPMTATFDVKMRVTARDPGHSMEFTAVGRSVKGAAGNIRATHVVRLQESGEGSTKVRLEGDVALGGMLGSVGQKVVAKQAAVVTQSFAQALAQELSGGSEPASAAAGSTPAGSTPGSTPAAPASETGDGARAEPPTPADPGGQSSAQSPPGGGRKTAPPPALIAGIVLLLLLLVIRRRRHRK